MRGDDASEAGRKQESTAWNNDISFLTLRYKYSFNTNLRT